MAEEHRTRPLSAPRGRIPPFAGAALAAALHLGGSARGASGGPDAFGYTWRDSAEPGVAYAWVDISATGTVLPAGGDDDNSGFQALSFPMRYYGSTYDQVAACTNGWLSLVDGASTHYTEVRLPSASLPQGTVAALWNDLLVDASARVLFQDFGDRAVVTWENVRDLGNPTRSTFQAILHADSRIVFQYQDVQSPLTSCAVGIEAPDGSDGLTVYYRAPFPTSAYAVELSAGPPLPTFLDCTTATPLACGAWLEAATTPTSAVQENYRCPSATSLAGPERVFELDLPAPTDVRVVLEARSGAPELIVLAACDVDLCRASGPGPFEIRQAQPGTLLVVDTADPAGTDFRIRADCLPVPTSLDCASAPAVGDCPTSLSGDLRAGAANQEIYGCTLDFLDGREQIHALSFANPVDLVIRLVALTGSPRLLLMEGSCDADACVDSGSEVALNDHVGDLFLVVDSLAGAEGAYRLDIECAGHHLDLCGGAVQVLTDPWDDGLGSWHVDGWLYPDEDTHDFTLRVDGGPTAYQHSGHSCPDFASHLAGVQQPNGPARVQWGSAEGDVVMVVSEEDDGACCGARVDVTVTNADAVPHWYEFRIYHDTAFGAGSGTCAGVVDGGPVEIAGVRHEHEVDLAAIGALGCDAQLRMFSGMEPGRLMSSWQVLPPNVPTVMELLDWDSGGDPCTDWSRLTRGQRIDACHGSEGDHSLLLAWRFPPLAGTLAPGESSTASYRVGAECAWTCPPCPAPVLGSGRADDVTPCGGGVELSWDPASFPDGASGTYHVYRSDSSFDDAMRDPPIAAGLSSTTWRDDSSRFGSASYYVVVAESLGHPGCGAGPSTGGSTDRLQIGPIFDDADVIGPNDGIGPTLRATGKTVSTVDFDWPLAADAGPGEGYALLRSDGSARGPFVVHARTDIKAVTDPDAPPRFVPPHVWFYEVRRTDACGNVGRH